MQPTPTKEVLAAVENVFHGQWYCREAKWDKVAKWTFVLVDAESESETSLVGVVDRYAVPILRDMVAGAEKLAADDELTMPPS